MKHPANIALVATVPERCRVCYTCVRECPAKAIRIVEGQAQVVPERCIGCANCVRVCSQGAKDILDGTREVAEILAGTAPTAAIVAPSFPAEFTDCSCEKVVGMLRRLGFRHVHEVGFAADLVAKQYRKLLTENRGGRFIATSCPAIVGYVERYYPEAVPALAPIVSPMIAAARLLRRLHGPELKIVFIGPCIAKKGEAVSADVAGDVDAVLTFVEMRRMLAERKITPDNVDASDFDPPRAGLGALFSISRGLLQAADIEEDLVQGEVVATDGRTNFVEAIKEFAAGDLDARLLEVLCCNGCIMGAGMSDKSALFSRRNRVSQYVRQRWSRPDNERWKQDIARFSDLDLSRAFQTNDQRIPQPSPRELKAILARMGKQTPEDELNCGACGYDTCYEHAIAIYKGLAENEMCLPYTIERLKDTVRELACSNEQLADTQEALMHSERLASMGQLAAGVAHEVNNPLGIVLMYAHMLMEEAGDQSEYRDDLKMIVEQADRCKKIVARLLHFARQNKVVLQPTDLAALVTRTVRSLPVPESVAVQIDCRTNDTRGNIDADQIAQVLTNLITNALDAMPEGGRLSVEVDGDADTVGFGIRDTGIGIPRENLAKVFEPFFTTKQIGKGTGLGLAVSYGIVKMHRGAITVESNADPETGPTGTLFKVTLPRNAEDE